MILVQIRFIDGQDIVPVDEARKIYWRSVAMQFVTEPEICHGEDCLLRAAVRFDSRNFLWLPKWNEGGSEGWFCPT